jgi:chromosomal replication initiation ATPase DnaA
LHHIIIREIEKGTTYYYIDVEELCSGSRQRLVARARSEVCYLAVRKLLRSYKDASQRLKISPSAVSNAIMKGRAAVVKRDGNEVRMLNK